MPQISAVMVNESRAMSRDESSYPNPETFDPERYLTASGERIGGDEPQPVDPRLYVFGVGRR